MYVYVFITELFGKRDILVSTFFDKVHLHFLDDEREIDFESIQLPDIEYRVFFWYFNLKKLSTLTHTTRIISPVFYSFEIRTETSK